MRKLVLLVVALIMGIAFTGCQGEPQSAMTAAEVVQHVNLVLENEYQYQDVYNRHETRYTALTAEQFKTGGQTLEIVWQVKVRVDLERQTLLSGIWIPSSPVSEIRTYRFLEKNAKLEPLEN